MRYSCYVSYLSCRVTSFYELDQAIAHLRVSFADPTFHKVVFFTHIHPRKCTCLPSCTRSAARRMRCGNGCVTHVLLLCGNSSFNTCPTPLFPISSGRVASKKGFGKTSGTCSIRSCAFLRDRLIPMDRGLFSIVITWRN